VKIRQEKYPLIDYGTRHRVMNEEMFRIALYTKLATSKHKGDQEFFPEYRQFIEYVANTREIKTYLIAKTVSDYLFKHSEPLMTKLWEYIPDIPDQHGAILWQDWTFFFRKFDDDGQCVILYMTLIGDKAEIGAVIKDRGDKGYVRGTPPEQSKAAAVGFTMCTLVLPFLTFAECETKVINAETGHRAKVNNEKYVTDIKSNVEIVDSNWFTTIIHSNGFNVSGHFRLQPIGHGRNERRLIWIKDFEKHGYTRRARVEVQKEQGIDN
jgi:hypothetical protein